MAKRDCTAEQIISKSREVELKFSQGIKQLRQLRTSA